MPELRERYGVKSLGVFGSYVRNEAKPKSDLDVLVEYAGSPSLFELVGLQNDLSDWLGVKVDLVPNQNLKPFIGKRILSEVVWLEKDGNVIPFRTAGRRQGEARMNPKREYLDFLNDIIDMMERAERNVAGKTFDEFIQDEIRVDALTKVVETIGEAAKHIPADVRARYPEIN